MLHLGNKKKHLLAVAVLELTGNHDLVIYEADCTFCVTFIFVCDVKVLWLPLDRRFLANFQL